jgi:hypothetical protein
MRSYEKNAGNSDWINSSFDRSRFASPHIQQRIEADQRRHRQFVQNREDRQKREERQEQAEDDFATLAGAVETALASSERLAAFEADLTVYGTATVEALMENDRLLAIVQAEKEVLLERAFVMEDGRRVFRTADGHQVFDEFGQEVSATELNPLVIPDSAPTWESYEVPFNEERRLQAERAEILDYQQRLDEAREAVASGTMTEAELTEFETELRESMSEAVRAQLPEDHPTAAVTQAAENVRDVAQSVQTPSLEGLQGFSMPSMGG